MKVGFFLFFLIIPLSLFPVRNPDLVSFSVGCFDFLRSKHRTCEFSVEYQFQFQYQFFAFRPLLGAMATVRGSTYAYGGVNFDFMISDLVFSPGIAAGWYQPGGGKNLRFPLEFRSCFEIAWQRSDFQRLGVRISHISNASLGYKNPGQESLVLFYSFPI